jgi:hypothetical protein
MVAKNIITSQYTKEGVKKLLSEVDDLVLKKKTEKNPEKLLKDKKEVLIDDTKGEIKSTIGKGTKFETTIGVKQFKGKVPEVSKETTEEFLKSFQANNIPKNILADFNIDKISSNEDIIKMINLIAKYADKKGIIKQDE